MKKGHSFWECDKAKLYVIVKLSAMLKKSSSSEGI